MTVTVNGQKGSLVLRKLVLSDYTLAFNIAFFTDKNGLRLRHTDATPCNRGPVTDATYSTSTGGLVVRISYHYAILISAVPGNLVHG